MLFLGQAGNFNLKKTFSHLFAFGSSKDSNNLRKYLARRYNSSFENVALYTNGRTALSVALKKTVNLEGHSSNNKVIIVGFTCYAVVQAVKSANCTPVFADIDTKTLHFNSKTLEKCLKENPDTKAVIIQNTLGIPCQIEEILKLAEKHHLVVIEDLAHSAGIFYKNGFEAGTLGDATILSFGKGKAIDTISGGALILRNKVEKSLSPKSGPKLSSTIPQPTSKPKFSNSLRSRWYPFFGLIIRIFYHVKLAKLETYALAIKVSFKRLPEFYHS